MRKFQSTRPMRGRDVERDDDCVDRHISIHTPREGRDARRSSRSSRRRNFNPRAPRGARPCSAIGNIDIRDFNPRAPRGARHTLQYGMFSPFRFQSTRPARGATRFITGSKKRRNISIHAPREGRDARRSSRSSRRRNFNPRAPRGARQKSDLS